MGERRRKKEADAWNHGNGIRSLMLIEAVEKNGREKKKKRSRCMGKRGRRIMRREGKEEGKNERKRRDKEEEEEGEEEEERG